MSKRKKTTNSADNAKKLKSNRADDDLNSIQHLFTIDEKRNFLKACQENGLSVIYDLKKLGEYLPGRSETEIRYLITTFERKSRYGRDNVDFEQTPLESWYLLCDQLIRSSMKREDSSRLLIDLMSKYSVTSSKYAGIYSYLKELMEGKYTSKLSAHDSIVFLCLIDTLSSFIKSHDLAALKDYIRRHYQRLNEQLASGEPTKRSEYLNYFQQIDPTKLQNDIQLASAQLNRRFDQQVADQAVACHEQQLNANSPEKESGNPANSQCNLSHSVEQQLFQQLFQDSSSSTEQTSEQTSEQTVGCIAGNKTPASSSASDQSQASLVSSFVSATTADDVRASSNLTNQHSSSNKQEQIADLISECSASNLSSALQDGSTQQPATGRPDQSLLKSANPLYQYSQLPTIDKIRQCLNPLAIPIELLRDLHSLLAANKL